MHIHILGICGTFMAGLALIAKELGYEVTGSDENVYPPMSTQLEKQGIKLMTGYQAENLLNKPDMVIIGNALSRGNPEVEAVLNQGLDYVSGAQWLAENVLQQRWVLAVAGTHGKTTTSSMLAWILDYQGFNPSFLIGGVPLNFGVSARLGASDFFVVEADEYDSAFFDKRSKFVHYRPRTLVLNNLEYDHADIFPNLLAIQKQFHHLIRTVPSEGLIIKPDSDKNLNQVVEMGCWTEIKTTSIAQKTDWNATLLNQEASSFKVIFKNEFQGKVEWTLTGQHNVYNALSALAAAHHVGILPQDAIQALNEFKSVKRRMEVIAKIKEVTLYDDFAHHPTAIRSTLNGLRKQIKKEKIIAVVELRSNTMRLGVHQKTLAEALQQADIALIYAPEKFDWDVNQLENDANNIYICHDLNHIIQQVKQQAVSKAHVLLMSNGSFGGIYQRLQEVL